MCDQKEWKPLLQDFQLVTSLPLKLTNPQPQSYFAVRSPKSLHLPLCPHAYPRYKSITTLDKGHRSFPQLRSEKLFVIGYLAQNLEGAYLFILFLKSSRLLALEDSAHQFKSFAF